MAEYLTGDGENTPHGSDPEGWKPVILGQLAGELLPAHPDLPETTEDELTQAALSDPEGLGDHEPETAPTLWRLVMLILITVGTLSIVFRFAR